MQSIDRVQASFRRSIQRRYDHDQRNMALAIAFLLMRFAPSGQLPTDPRTLLWLKAAIWAQVLKPYYIGTSTSSVTGDEPFNGATPLSPFAELVRDGVEGAMRIQIRRSVSLLKRYIKDEAILSWFIGPSRGNVHLPPVRQENYQLPFYAYTDPNGYKLNDRILRNAVDARAKLNRMLDYHMGNGTPLAALGAAVSNYMTISGRSTRQPYGEYGSYAPWKMLRGEMLVAAGRATIVTSLLNPVVDRVQWRLSPTHRDLDECDDNAYGGENGDGVYPANGAPTYPSHNNCRCSLWPIDDEDASAIGVTLRGSTSSPAARPELVEGWRGSLNEYALMRALMNEPVREFA